MPQPSGTLDFIGALLGRLLASVEERFSEGQVRLLFAELGMEFPPELETKPAFMNAVAQAAHSAALLPGALVALANAIQDHDIIAILSRRLELFNLIKDTISKFKVVAIELKNVSGSLPGVDAAEVTGFADQLPDRLLDLLVISTLEAAPGLVEILEFTGSIERQEMIFPDFEFTRRDLKPDELIKFLQSPGEQLKNLYRWGATDFDGLLLLQRFEKLLVSNGFPALLITSGTTPILDALFAEISAKTDMDPVGLQIKINEPIHIENASPITRDHWTLESAFNGQLDPEVVIVIQPNGNITFQPPSGELQGGAGVTWTGGSMDGEAYILLGENGGSRIEVKQFVAQGKVDFVWNNTTHTAEGAFQASGQVKGGKVVIDFSQGDSFLKDILSGVRLESDVNLGLGFSSQEGIHFIGSSTLEIELPLHQDLGLVELKALIFSVGFQDRSFPISIGANIKAELGPLAAVVEQIGIKADLSLPRDHKGNIGPIDLDLGFLPPRGLGLSINGGGFSGGGFLRYYEEDERYEGMLELEYEDKISLKAIGLITTRLPGGKDGFSLVIIITAEFTPIQLGLGFTLNGVGGMLGYNRTAEVERLRSGLRGNSLSSVLFPQNIVENASRILSDLNQLFPVQEGRFIFGPMARIGWGSPTRITIDLGLLIEVPSPVRVLILGVIRAVLPDEEAKLLYLQVNFLGVIDFEAQKLSFDASLYDSKLLGFTLSGDMAVRMCWGDEPNFLLTVGGFHPQYEPPPLNLPTLRRLTLQLTSGTNPRLSLETYFAVTSNTVQFGAKVELYAGGYFAVYGFLSFDVLFQFNPFYFIASIQAKVALLAGGSEIASVSLDFTLEGPTPWHVKGKAKLKICWFLTITVPFDVTFGEERDTRLDDIAVIPLLKVELSRAESWEAQLLSRHQRLVSTGKVEVPAGEVVASPFGTLTVQQKLVPLGMTIQQVGSQKPADGNHFAIHRVLAGETDLAQRDVQDQFAPAQYFEMSDADKLSSKKAFEPYPSGVRVDDSPLLQIEYGVVRVVEYELSYLDEQREHLPKPERVAPNEHSFHAWALSGAVAASPLSQARRATSALAPGKVQVQSELFVVVHASDLTPVEEVLPTTQAQADQHLQQLRRSHPHHDLLVIPLFEVNRL